MFGGNSAFDRREISWILAARPMSARRRGDIGRSAMHKIHSRTLEGNRHMTAVPGWVAWFAFTNPKALRCRGLLVRKPGRGFGQDLPVPAEACGSHAAVASASSAPPCSNRHRPDRHPARFLLEPIYESTQASCSQTPREHIEFETPRRNNSTICPAETPARISLPFLTIG